MPQAWRVHWSADVDDADVRDALLHTLGNLTLVSGQLNPTLSNRPWHGDRGILGKRAYLLEHSGLSLNARIVARHETAWTDRDIRRRTEELIDAVIAEWPRPVTGADPSLDHERAPEPEHTGKYRVLHDWLLRQPEDELPMGFEAVEAVLGIPLPGSARAHTAHWYGYGGTALGRAIRDAGWRATEVELGAERLVLVRVP